MMDFIEIPINVTAAAEIEKQEKYADMAIEFLPEWEPSVMLLRPELIASFYPGVTEPDTTILELETGVTIKVVLTYEEMVLLIKPFAKIQRLVVQ